MMLEENHKARTQLLQIQREKKNGNGKSLKTFIQTPSEMNVFLQCGDRGLVTEVLFNTKEL